MIWQIISGVLFVGLGAFMVLMIAFMVIEDETRDDAE